MCIHYNSRYIYYLLNPFLNYESNEQEGSANRDARLGGSVERDATP
jgi:hypothetical protein